MRSHHPRLAVLVGLSFIIIGCGDDQEKPSSKLKWDGSVPAQDSTVVNLDAFTVDFGEIDLGAIPDGLRNNEGGPKLELLSPTVGQVITSDVMTLRIKITDPEEVDSQKVTVRFQGDKEPAVMNITSTPDVYERKLDISSFASKFRIIVYAVDLEGNETEKTFDLERDPGPRINFLSPAEDSRHRRNLTIQILVIDKVEITRFEARIGSVKIPLINQSTESKKQIWVGTIKFDDKMFEPPLSEKQVILAEAENKNKAVAQMTRSFQVDDKGPKIEPIAPKTGELIGGVIAVKAKISDEAGILQSSVRCVIGNKLETRNVKLTASSGSNEYAGQFDTRTLNQQQLWPVISFRATDNLGNESHYDFEVALDNGQPIVELDPPSDFYMRQPNKNNSKIWECSHPFDPVGPFAANDLHRVPQIQEFRVRIEDQGNNIYSAKWTPIASVNQASTWLYILDDTSQPLVIDTDGDGYCDDINPDIIPIGSEPRPTDAVALKLVSVAPGGSADYFFVRDEDGNEQFSVNSKGEYTPLPYQLHPACHIWGLNDKPPTALCLPVLTTVKIYSTAVKTNPAIYTIPPVDSKSDGFKCLGLPFDFRANNIEDGWACAAAVADDNLGNRGVSPPIRVMVDKDWKSRISIPLGPTEMTGLPHCTGTMQSDGKISSSKACKFRNPRDPTLPQNKAPNCTTSYCKNCSSYYPPADILFPQQFSHCEILNK